MIKIALLTALFLLPTPLLATPINRAQITQIKRDQKGVFINNKVARLRDIAWKGQRVLTKNSMAELKFNNGTVGRLATNSLLTVGAKCGKLGAGSILVSGKMDICSPRAVFGVRGTVFRVDLDKKDNAKLTVLEGVVNFKAINTGKALDVKAGQQLLLNNQDEFGAIQNLDYRQYNNEILQPETTEFNSVLPKFDSILRVFQNLMIRDIRVPPNNNTLSTPSLPKL